MIQNKFGEMIFNEDDVCDLLMQGYGFDELTNIVVDESVNIENLVTHLEHPDSLLTWSFPYSQDTSVQGFHDAQQLMWHMPEEYKTLDIEKWLYEQCTSQISTTRVTAELDAFKARNMLDLLRWLKYFVDTCSKEGVVWGVGRGSSVASYVLYLIGVHKIDSIKYKLPIEEFFKEI